MTDSYFADVSQFQRVVDDSYPLQLFSFRSNDGTYQDHNFLTNYLWAVKQANAGKLACFIVYFYWRPNWLDTVNTHKAMVKAAGGGPHPRMISMIDVERGGNPGGDQSDSINRAYWNLTDWYGTSDIVGSTRRVIGYANSPDYGSMWVTRPSGLRVIGAGYGSDPRVAGQIAHQYTDGTGYDPELIQGVAPFGSCDMNVADGYTPQQFAAACGVPTDQEASMSAADDELTKKFPSRSIYRVNDQPVDTLAGIVLDTDARVHEAFVAEQARLGVPGYLEMVQAVAANGIAGPDLSGLPADVVADSKARAQAVLDDIARNAK